MAQDYTVTAIVKDETWDGKDDKMRTVELALEGVGQTVKSIGLAKFKPPSQGDTVHGEVDGDRFRFKKRQNGAQPSSQASGDEYARRPDHPDNAARMRHSSALGAAPAYYELLRTEGVISQAESKEKALETLRGLIRWLEDSYPVTNPDEQIGF